MSAIIKYLPLNEINIPLIFEKDNSLPIISLTISFKNSGHIFDDKESLSSLTSKLFYKGTKKDGSFNFSNKLERNAILLNSHFSSQNFYFSLESLKDKFNYGLELFKDLLLDPNFDDKIIKSIKNKLISKIKQLESNFDYLSSVQLKKMIYKDTPLERTAIGTPESINNISMEDIKNKIKSDFILDNMIITIGGDLTEKKAVEYSNKIISLFKRGNSSKNIYISIKNMDQNSTKRKIVPSEQAYIYFASPLLIKTQSENRHFATVSSFILGSSGFGSRLMEEIRVKKGLAYSIYSSFNIEKSHSYFSGFLQTKISNEEEAIKSIKELIQNFIENGVTQEELTSAKQFILGSQALRKETLSNRLNIAFNNFYEHNSLNYFDEQIKLIESIKLSELNQFIKSHNEILNLFFSIVTGKNKNFL